MIKCKCTYIGWVLLTIFSIKVEAQRISLNQISFSQPLPSSSVYRIFQDNTGFMWFGTPEGLCRYDGYRTVTFKSDYNNPNLLTDNDITALAEDDDYIWIGTRKGVNILDKKTCIVSHFRDEVIAGSEIKFIRVTSDKSVWIGTTQGLFRYKGELPVKHVLTIGTSDFFEDRNGNIWLATWGQGLYRYKTESDSFEKYPKIGAGDTPCKIFQDEKGQMWICTWGDGLFLFNPERNDEEMYHRLQTIHPTKGFTENVFYSAVQDDRYKYIWTISYNGFYVFEYDKNGELKPVDMSHLFATSNNTFSEVIKGRDGNLWIATFGEGVITVDFDLPVTENFALPEIKRQTGFSPRISAIYAFQDEIWFYQMRYGLGIYSIKENKTRFYDYFSSLFINLFRSCPNEIWLAGYSDIIRVTKDGKMLNIKQTLQLDSVTAPGWISKMYEDRSNNIWCGTDRYLFVKPAGSEYFSKTGIPVVNISDITEDTLGNLWISSFTDGICRISGDAKKTVKIFGTAQGNLVSNNIVSVCADKKGRIWIGTKEGYLLQYNVAEDKMTDVTNTVNSSSKQILNIIDDNSGNIWFSTNDAITVYNPENGAFRNFTSTDGITVNSFIKNSCFKDDSGKLYFGGNNGICTFNPEVVFLKLHATNKPLVTDVKIDNKPVFQNNANPRFDIARQYLELSPGDRNIEINFSTLDYINSSKIHYAYKMEGLDDDWTYVQPGRQFAIYNRPSKGTYKLMIKATDENHIWQKEAAVLTVYRSPALYETWWAYLLYICVVASFVFYAYLRAKNRMKLQNSLKMAQIEKEKSEELIQTKLRFFTNIGHEFRTPLTLIITPLSILIHQLTDENLKQKLSSIYRNAESMLGLINQLLDFRKLEMGGEKLKLQCDDFVKFTQYVHLTFKDIAENKSIQFTFESDIRQLFMAFDKSKVRKIINNLYSNALKFTPEGGYIATTVRPVQENGRAFICMDIADSGCGIPDKEQQIIFNRFYQSENNDPDKTGSGIGLHLVKEYVELHGGQIKVDSKIGKGSVFSIFIPADLQLFDDSAEKEDLNSGSVSPETEINPDQKQKTLLIVEDNTELRHFLAEQLGDRFNVLQASDGKQG
ncbi:MAG: hybrid sensor histidine kinase/response regulator, partial [Tannerella sp.]|nr:hybrid sensor histidine kinase/response regulator [Tannerella sp.]